MTAPRPEGLHEKQPLQALLRVLDIFREMSPTMPADYVAAFLIVALDPGKQSAGYAKALKLPTNATERLLRDIGSGDQFFITGLGLVARNQQSLEYTLTEKGRALLAKLIRVGTDSTPATG